MRNRTERVQGIINMNRLLILLRTLPARLRASRLGWGFGDCPICHVPFSCETLGGISHAAALYYSPVAGRLVCSKPTCQDTARKINRERWGRDGSDPWNPGDFIWQCPNPACGEMNTDKKKCWKCGHPRPGQYDGPFNPAA